VIAAIGPLWHVTLRAAGDPDADAALERALRRLCSQDPGNMAARYGRDRAELQFWDEGEIAEVTAAALDLWVTSRGSAGLPDWPLVAVEVHDQATWRERQLQAVLPLAPGSVLPLA
jgi:hypothetical protein